MKLRNKKTGEIGYLIVAKGSKEYKITNDEWDKCGNYDSLAELNEEWEDYEEPKDGWCIDYYDAVKVSPKYDALIKEAKLIGNYFETKEEAEKALGKLEAWKRLKDKGFKVDLWDYDGGNYQERIRTGRILFRVKDYEENDKDLDLLFSQEDD